MAPRILGQDGKFRIERDAMGVPGLHVAVNVFEPALHKKLFQDEVFVINAQDFVLNQAGPPLKQCILHPIAHNPLMGSPWPDDWHRLINAVRDSGLFPEATIPDNAYALTYRPGSEFECHHDGRGKWGEYVICVSLGSPCTITFQHGAPKNKPFDPTKPSSYVPPVPPEDAYWTRSLTDEPVQQYRRQVWQVSMTLPPNSMYVMSGASRYDWRHGINVNQKYHPLSRYDPTNTFLFPSWNSQNLRRAVIFRSTKVFSNVSLEVEYERARQAGDRDKQAELGVRKQVANRYPPDVHNTEKIRKASPEEVQQMSIAAHYVLQELQQGNAMRLRFAPNQVNFDSTHQVRAVADFGGQGEEGVAVVDLGGDAPAIESTGGGGGGTQNEGNRLGGGADTEVIVIDDSSDEEEEENRVPTEASSRKRPAESAQASCSTATAEEERARIRAARIARLG